MMREKLKPKRKNYKDVKEMKIVKLSETRKGRKNTPFENFKRWKMDERQENRNSLSRTREKCKEWKEKTNVKLLIRYFTGFKAV